ncbi:methyltransferase domain-containing protein [Streptomyces armeniacus]|uniref:methyltransferase domain-containing protein n=1 Tax=Streptomyces armeniacus TaxID=83291 RepID=UPI001FE41549|nr:methyltransferase domain-containing protein [Streptomyces armeniacus]
MPRRDFLPDVLWLRDGHGGYTRCDRAREPDRWEEAAYSDAPLVTRIEREEDGAQTPTSSASAPSTVVRMLEQAELADGMRVLEIGTGTGFHTALLCHRLGDRNVTTIDLDQSITHRARKHLAAAGYHPGVITGDGADGVPDRAPFDRIIATCSVRTVPSAWLEQVRAGARLVLPWSTSWLVYGTLELTRYDDVSASGRWHAYGSYMGMRGQHPVSTLADVVHPQDAPDRGETDLSPWHVAGQDLNALFAVGLRVPDVWHSWDTDPGTAGVHTRLWLADDAATSWASVDYDGTRSDRFAVAQHGDRRLWDEVYAAHAAWRTAGRPDISRHRVAVTRGGQHVRIGAADA